MASPNNANADLTNGNVYLELNTIPYAIAVGPYSSYADLLVYYQAPTSGSRLASGVGYLPGSSYGTQGPTDPSLIWNNSGAISGQPAETYTETDVTGNTYTSLVTPNFSDGYAAFPVTPHAPMTFAGWPLRPPDEPVSDVYDTDYNDVPSTGRFIITTYPLNAPAMWLGRFESQAGYDTAGNYNSGTQNPPESNLDVIVYLQKPDGGIPTKRPNRRWKVRGQIDYSFQGNYTNRYSRYIPVQYRRGWRFCGKPWFSVVGSPTVTCEVWGVKTPCDVTTNPMYVTNNSSLIGTVETLLYKETTSITGTTADIPMLDISCEPNGYDWVCFRAYTSSNANAIFEGWMEAWD